MPSDAVARARRIARPQCAGRTDARPHGGRNLQGPRCRRSPPANGASSTSSMRPPAAGSAGIAIDRTEAEAMRAELARMVEAHRRVLDQLATGVAIFNVDRKLIFYNTAFRSLFELEAGLPRPDSDRLLPCSTRCAPSANCRSSRISGSGSSSCTKPTAPSSRRSTCGTCPTAAPCASSPRPIRKAASPTSMTTSPSGWTCTAATTR